MSFLDKFFNKGPKPIIAESQPRDLSILKAGNRPQGPGVMAHNRMNIMLPLL